MNAPIKAASFAPVELFDADSELPHTTAPHPVFAAILAQIAPPVRKAAPYTFRVYDNLYDLSRPRADEQDDEACAQDDDEDCGPSVCWLPNAAGQMIP